jgi:hypothetical protein
VFSRLTLILLGLAACVFLWGLQYKLSLYDPPQATSHQVPIAKLLSKDENAGAQGGILLTGGDHGSQGVTQFFLITGLLLLLSLRAFSLPDLWERARDASRTPQLRANLGLNAFFFRPPPSLL